MLYASNKGIVTQKHDQTLSNLIRFVVCFNKFLINFTNYVLYINVEREIIINIATTDLVGGSGYLSLRKLCNLVNFEVLLKLCFREFNLL